ncbi:cupin domain-containing protein [Draconibacterium sp.]|nr:cupin domain-containing protein [Draconibacterium sp.]
MNLNKKFKEINEYFAPKVVGEVNDVYIKIAKIKGDEIPWHNHKKEDEMFYVIEGNLLFEIEGEEPFSMHKGDLFVVTKGINHRVSSERECKIMLIENKTTLHTGNVQSKVTKTIEEQLK